MWLLGQSLHRCPIVCVDAEMFFSLRGGEGVHRQWLLLFYLPVGGDQAPHVLPALTASCTSLTFKAGFSAGPCLTELSIYLFRNGKITALTRRALSSTAFGFMWIAVCWVASAVKGMFERTVWFFQCPPKAFHWLEFCLWLLKFWIFGYLPLIASHSWTRPGPLQLQNGCCAALLVVFH